MTERLLLPALMTDLPNNDSVEVNLITDDDHGRCGSSRSDNLESKY